MNVVVTILIILICIIVLILFKVKNKVTYKHHTMLAKAIYSYHLYCVGKRWIPVVGYDDMESYEQTLFRWWDWGYTRILRKNKLELIELFITENNNTAKDL